MDPLTLPRHWFASFFCADAILRVFLSTLMRRLLEVVHRWTLLVRRADSWLSSKLAESYVNLQPSEMLGDDLVY